MTFITTIITALSTTISLSTSIALSLSVSLVLFFNSNPKMEIVGEDGVFELFEEKNVLESSLELTIAPMSKVEP